MSTLASVVIRDLIANQPAAGVAGRLFFATDTGAAYRDSGTAWETISAVDLATESANLVYAGPASGSAATPTFRALVAADLPVGPGTVTSVALTTPSWMSVSGSPVTGSGTIAVTATSGETANEFLATPNGSTGAVGLRAIAAADLPLATTSVFGAVKPDGTTVTISSGIITATSGAGTVTSVGISVPADYSVSGSPVTTSGTLAVTENTQAANLVKAGPTSGLAAEPTFRALIASDLPLATTSAFGAVKPDGSTVDVTSGVISVPTGSTSILGLVRPDGTTIDVTSGVISVPTATTSLLGLVKPDGSTVDVSSGVISVPTATTTLLGLVKPDGTTITISSGVISASGGGGGGGGGTPGLVFLGSRTASASTELDFTSLITSTYIVYEVVISGMSVTTFGDAPMIQFSTDNGITYDGSSVYQWTNVNAPFTGGGSGAGTNTPTSNPDIGILIYAYTEFGLNNNTSPGLVSTFRIYDPLSTSSYKMVSGQGVALDHSSGVYVHYTFSGIYPSTSACNAFRILVNGEGGGTTLATGIVSLYGLAT